MVSPNERLINNVNNSMYILFGMVIFKRLLLARLEIYCERFFWKTDV